MHPAILSIFLLANPAPADLRAHGAFGFPQRDATVLCDRDDLRVSVWSNAEHFVVQAVLWKDGDDSIGETEDGRDIGDWSTVLLDCDGDRKVTANVDRSYSLNPWPQRPGLHYSVMLSDSGSTGLKGDSKGRGGISYVTLPEGRVRVDTFLVPLAEVLRKPGDRVQLAYWGSSAKPQWTVNSLGVDPATARTAHALPREKWHELALSAKPGSFDVQQVPEVRQKPTERSSAKPKVSIPRLGATIADLPEIAAEQWLNWSEPAAPTLASLKGKVVVLEFWATWCGPCRKGIPHLNDLHDKHQKDGLVILSFTNEPLAAVEKFMAKTPMKYPIGIRSPAGGAYGAVMIPHAAIIDREGVLRWQGNPQAPGFDTMLSKLLNPS